MIGHTFGNGGSAKQMELAVLKFAIDA